MLKILFLIFSISTMLISKEKVTLQLKWFHQFQFAGYYAAKEKGFYSDVGLEVELKERDLRYNNVEEVINGKAQYGVADSVLMLYKARKEPIVIVSPIFQHSPNTLISLKEKNIKSLFDMKDKKILFYANDTDALSILSMLKKFNIEDVTLIRKRIKEDYLKLLNGEVDLMAGYITNEPFYFLEKGIDVNIINPAHYGFDLYGDMLFTNENEVLNHPDRVKRFKEASLKGWKYALNNKEEIVNLIYEKYSKRKSKKHLMYEANAIEKMISNDIIPMGTFDQGRIEYIANLYKEYKILNDVPDIKNFIFEDYVSQISSKLTKEERDYLINKKVLKVANLKSFPPYNYNVNSKPEGYMVDYFRLVANMLNIKVEFVTKNWSELIPLVKSKEIDIIPHMAINEERSKNISFTDFSPVVYQTAIAIPVDSKVSGLNDLVGKKVSILENSFLEFIIRKDFPDIELVTTKTIEAAVKLVSEGKVQAVVDELSILEYHKKNKWISNIKTLRVNDVKNVPSITPLYIAVKKDNLLLKSILEKVNASVSANEIIKLKNKWLEKAHINSIDFSKKEYDYLKNRNSINYCIDYNRMPIEGFDENAHIGMTQDIIKIIEDKTNINFNLVDRKKDLQENQGCELSSLMLKENDSDKLYTNKFLSLPLALATNYNEPYISSFNSLNSKNIGYVKNSINIDTLTTKYPQVKFIELDSIKEGLDSIQYKKIYGLLGTLPELGYQVQKNYHTEIKISGNINEKVEYSFSTNEENSSLVGIINKVLNSISEEKKLTIYNKWNSIKYERSIDFKKIMIAVSIVVLIFFIILYKNRQIRAINDKMKIYIRIVDEHVLTSTTDLKGNITYASKAFCKISGYKNEELMGQNHNIVRHEDMPDSIFKNMWETIKSGKKWRGELKNKTKEGSVYWVDTNVEPIFSPNKKIVSYMSVRHNISDRKKVEEISITDELTGLYNRRYFNQILYQELHRAKREKHPLALIILDVDYFKQYNDNYGHQKGDFVLSSIGKELKAICKRTSDFPFRIGGEEFAIIFNPRVRNNALDFAKTINAKIEALKIEHSFSKASSFITVSVGVYSEIGESLESEEEIYNHADKALYKAKEKGRNQVVLWEG